MMGDNVLENMVKFKEKLEILCSLILRTYIFKVPKCTVIIVVVALKWCRSIVRRTIL